MTEQKPHIRPHRPVVSTVPAGCLVIIGGVVLVALGLAIFGMAYEAPGYRNTGTYREAMRLVQSNARARDALGEPIEEAALLSFITEEGDEDAALRVDYRYLRRLSLRVKGPKGQATLFAQGREKDSDVVLNAAVLTLGDGRTLELREVP